ncbi:outer membrane protein [Methylocapsa sp. S129]|uniref:outer membrane protein n=1 Tax=Methylocapsa sp. S129 TaxID=1641869 RepID=UPI00131C5EB0|nr:outer membrane beta-barrel protein [Methylocapsa sp. S129]
MAGWNMKKHWRAGVLALPFLTGAASAADLPTKKGAPVPYEPTFAWTGFYAGLNAGYGWIDDRGPSLCFAPDGVANGFGCLASGQPSGAQVSPRGFIGGAQVGYNWQMSPSWLVGVEADLQGSGINGSVNVSGPFVFTVGSGGAGESFTASERMNWFGTVRPRIGFVMDRALIYATGGLAYGQVKVSSDFLAVGNYVNNYPASGVFTRTGWTVGGGVEYALSSNWSAKLEGLYYDLGRIALTGSLAPSAGVTPSGYTIGKSFDVNGGIVRVGLNYKFF